LNNPLKGVTDNKVKFVQKIATICKLLQAVGGPVWTVPELVFEKKQLIPALQQMLLTHDPQPVSVIID